MNIIYHLDKPSGITVNRSETTIHEETVQDFIQENFQFPISNFQNPITKNDSLEGVWKSPEEAFKERAGIAHRIDKETSGILLVAKTIPAFIELQRQFKERIVKKSYTALAHGLLIPKEGEINVPVGRLEFNRKRFGVVAGGRESKTRYRVISNFQFPTPIKSGPISNNKKHEEFSLVELFPETGRTHQIRVHLKYLNHPIFSDELYAGRKTAREDRKLLPRLFLHASKISFIHPAFGKEISFESPLPEELNDFLEKLQK